MSYSVPMTRIMRILTAIFATVALVTLGIASPASAATRGGSCKLSANWRVNVSATWYGNNLAYTVMSSPGALHVATQFPPIGNSYSYAFDPEQEQENFQSQGIAPPYVYRAFHTDPNSSKVLVFVFGGSGACNVPLSR